MEELITLKRAWLYHRDSRTATPNRWIALGLSGHRWTVKFDSTSPILTWKITPNVALISWKFETEADRLRRSSAPSAAVRSRVQSRRIVTKCFYDSPAIIRSTAEDSESSGTQRRTDAVAHWPVLRAQSSRPVIRRLTAKMPSASGELMSLTAPKFFSPLSISI